MSVVPVDRPMTAALCQQVIGDLAQAYPFIQTRVLTSTAYGRPVTAMRIGQGDRRVIFSAAHHANEWITTPVLLKFAEDLAQAIAEGGSIFGVPGQMLKEYCTIRLVPMVDPDGVDLVTGAFGPGDLEYQQAQAISADYPEIPFPDGWKANLLGVDLNLQYPAGWLQAREIKFSQGFTSPAPRDYVGRFPLSQLETRALAQYTEQWDPDLVLALHTQGQEIYWQFKDYEVPGARELAEEFARLSGYRVAETPYASAFAGYKDWFIQNWRRPGFTIEAGLGESPLPLSQFPEIYRDVLGILVTAATGLPA